ncbi:hypothetical protein [Olsenella urininfantis]|uniref:hypothetical protein n=1 Tax=Olsenella urininfantis TaxID=1871033 RepID=UPI000986D26B|nr:hypothetical protein [Olsenella urininfantis]
MKARLTVGKIARIAFAGALALVMGCGLAGCANDEQLIKESITSALDTFKAPTKEALMSYEQETGETFGKEFDKYGIDGYEFLEHCFARFDYEVGKVEVQGDKATVELTLTNVNFNDAIKAAQDELLSDDNAEQLAALYAEGGEKAIVQKYVETFYAKMDGITETASTPATMTLSKKDGSWEVDDASLEGVISAAYGGADFSDVS